MAEKKEKKNFFFSHHDCLSFPLLNTRHSKRRPYHLSTATVKTLVVATPNPSPSLHSASLEAPLPAVPVPPYTLAPASAAAVAAVDRPAVPSVEVAGTGSAVADVSCAG